MGDKNITDKFEIGSVRSPMMKFAIQFANQNAQIRQMLFSGLGFQSIRVADFKYVRPNINFSHS